MTWNYRIVKYYGFSDPEVYALHEVYYEEDGSPKSMTVDPIGFSGETPEEVIQSMELALESAKSRPVFEEPEAWSKWKV